MFVFMESAVMTGTAKRQTLTLALAAGTLVLGMAAVQAQPADVSLYEGQQLQGSGITLGAWGSGVVKDTEEKVFTGVRSIKLTTHGQYQGGRIILSKPASLQAAMAQPASYLEVVLRMPTDETTSGMGGLGGMMGMPGMGGGMGMPGLGGKRGSRGGSSGPGMPGMGGGKGGGMGMPGGSGSNNLSAGINEPDPIANIRLVLVMDDGKTVEASLPIEDARRRTDSWKSLALPLSSLKSLAKTSGSIKEVRIFGDSVGTMFVGRVRVVQDQTPIRVDQLAERTAAVNDQLTFIASAEAGISPLKYEWTLVRPGEKAEKPLPVDAEGRVFKHQFRKSGNYQVILTVRDPYGLKAPVSTNTKIEITL